MFSVENANNYSTIMWYKFLRANLMLGCSHSDVFSILGHTSMTTNIVGHEGIGRVVKGKQANSLILSHQLENIHTLEILYSYFQQKLDTRHRKAY
jgi:hypothetical protein